MIALLIAAGGLFVAVIGCVVLEPRPSSRPPNIVQ